jgi:hypothetical protein
LPDNLSTRNPLLDPVKMSYLLNKLKRKKSPNPLAGNYPNGGSRASDIGQPFMVKHNIHVGINSGLSTQVCLVSHPARSTAGHTSN